MKTAILGLFAILLLIVLTLFIVPGCNKSTELAAINKTVPLKGKSANADTVPAPPTDYATVPLAREQITLTPYFIKSQTSDSTYLSFSVQTKNSYCNTSSIKFADSVVNNSYDISLLGITVQVPCIIGVTQIGTVINFTQNEPNSLPNGTFPLNVTLNGTTYTGSITASSTIITFNWTYTSGVLISPTQISR